MSEQTVTAASVRRLVALAYEQGWRDACDDFLEQGGTPTVAGNAQHPIGARHRAADALIPLLDPNDLLGLRP